MTVKLRSGRRPGETSGFELAHRLVAEAGVAAIGFHPRSAAVHHKGVPDYELAARLVESLDAPVILTGGLNERRADREAFHSTGAAAVMLARGALGNPWLFEQLLGSRRQVQPSREEVLAGAGLDDRPRRRAPRRGPRDALPAQVLPWYVQRLELRPPDGKGDCKPRCRRRRHFAEARDRLAILLRSLKPPGGETPRSQAGFCCSLT